MQTVTRQQSRPELAAERRAAGAERRAGAAETNAAQDRAEAARLARELAEMRDDRDRWRTQAERLAAALERLKVPVPQGESAAVVRLPAQGEDLLYGVPRIAAAFKLTPQQVYHLKDKHGLPTFKTGRIVCAHASAVRRWFAVRGAAPQGGH